MPQIEGKILRRWLASPKSTPDRLIGLEAESLTEDREPARIVEASRAGLALEIGAERLTVPIGRIHQWVVCDAPQSLLARIEADVLEVPLAVADDLKTAGFDPTQMSAGSIHAVQRVIAAFATGQAPEHDDVEAVGVLLGSPTQRTAAVSVLEKLLGSNSIKTAGTAAIRLAKDASDRGDLAKLRALTAAALSQRAQIKPIPENIRKILLNIRAAGIAQLAQSCSDLQDAKKAADTAYRIGGSDPFLSNTYALIRRRTEALRCQM